MSFEEGISVGKVQQLKDMKFNLNQIAETISFMFHYMTFVKGFSHADPHPGNILIR